LPIGIVATPVDTFLPEGLKNHCRRKIANSLILLNYR